LGCLEPVFRAEALLAVVALGLVLAVLAVLAVWALVLAVFRYSFAISYFEIERELIIRVALGL
jgi:hypothetical protein